MLRHARLGADPGPDFQGALWGTYSRRFGNGSVGCFGGPGTRDKSLMDNSKFMLNLFSH